MGYFQDYRIKAGYDQALNTLVNIESITATGDRRAFYSPKSEGLISPGAEEISGDGLDYFNGYVLAPWLFDALTRPQLAYARATWCGGGWSGKVTIYTNIGNSVYQRFNAVLRLTPPADNGQGEFFAYRRYVMKMTRLSTPA